jgi:hypothetical protein
MDIATGEFYPRAGGQSRAQPTIDRSLTMSHRKVNALLLSLVLVFSGLSMRASAAVEAREQRIADVHAALARDDVREAMIELGVDPVDAEQRVASLSDTELQQLEGQLDQLPAGGGALAVIGIVFVVLMILEFTGVIDIFKKA